MSRYFAVAAGACASAASLFGKLSGLPKIEEYYFLRCVFFISMIICNTFVWSLYVKALQAASSSLSATVTSAATNYLCSALLGFLIFDEMTSLLWWAGAGLILMGLMLIITDQIKFGDDLLVKAQQDTKAKLKL